MLIFVARKSPGDVILVVLSPLLVSKRRLLSETKVLYVKILKFENNGKGVQFTGVFLALYSF